MKNITLKVDDEIYRKARILAAQKGSSVSAMVREFLTAATKKEESRETGHKAIVAEMRKIYAEADERAIPRKEPLKPLTREEIYAERLP